MSTETEARVRIRVAGRASVSEGVIEHQSDSGLFVRVGHPPDPGIMTLVEFLTPDEVVESRRTACVVMRRSPKVDQDIPGGMALEYVELEAPVEERPEPILERFLRFFGRSGERKSATEPELVPLADTLPPEPPREGPIVGIDLGTINSCVALAKDGEAEVIRGPRGYSTLPSVVYFGANAAPKIGHAAREKMILEPRRVVYSSKRFLGRPFTSSEVRRWGHFFLYQMVQGPGGTTAVKIGDRLLSLERVSSEILGQLKRQAEEHLGRVVNRAVISVPAYFGEPQRNAVRTAGRMAGFWVERIINEPTAAAVAYGFGRELHNNVLVYDLGGGTFDVSILRINGNSMEVLATDGDPFLGGADFDDRLTEAAFVAFQKEHGLDLRSDLITVQRVRFAAEKAKIQLTDATDAAIEVPFVSSREGGGHIDMRVPMTRAELEKLTGDIVDRTLGIADGVLKAAGMVAGDIDEVILVGGQTRTPLVQARVRERFGSKLSKRAHPDEAIAQGAALVAETIHAGLPMDLHDILAVTIRRSTPDGGTEVLLAHGTPLPASKDFEIPAQAEGEVRVALYRGEAERAEDNSFIGALTLQGNGSAIPARLEVSPDGLMSAQARDPESGDMRAIRVTLLDSA